MRLSICLKLALAALVVCLQQAHAACPFGVAPGTELANRPAVLFGSLAKDECIGDLTNDPDPLTKAVLVEDLREGPGEKKITLDALAFGVRAALIRLAAHAETQRAAATGAMQGQWAAVASELVAAAKKSDGLKVDKAYELADAADKLVGDGWRQYRARPDVALNVGGGSIRPKCFSDEPPESCDHFESRIRMWRVVTLTAAVQHRLQGLANDERMRAYEILLKRWSSYRTDAPHQTPWELAWNSARMNADPSICPRDKTGQRIGFCKVPQSQMILMHPDVGLRLSRNANNSSELKPYLVVELIGRNTFTWLRSETDDKAKPEDIAKIDRQFGYSLAAAYGYDRDRNRWAVGPMLRWNGYNLAITRSTSGRWALTMNTTLSNNFFEKRETITTKLQSLGLN